MLILVLMVALSPVCMFGQTVTIVLKEEAQVANREITLRDISDLQGGDAGLVSKLASISLGPSPRVGLVRILSRNQIQALIPRPSDSGLQLTFAGASVVQVKLRSRSVDSAQLAQVIKKQIMDWIGGAAEIDVRSIGNISAIELPEGEIEFRVLQKSHPATYRNLTIPVEASMDGKSIRIFSASVDVSIRMKVLQAARRLAFGSVVSPADLREAVVEIADGRTDYIVRQEEAVGRILRRSLSPGDFITQEAVALPVLVKTGETVRLLFERGGIAIAALAKAEQSGKMGQTIWIRNLEFARPIKAQVVGRGEVRIE